MKLRYFQRKKKKSNSKFLFLCDNELRYTLEQIFNLLSNQQKKSMQFRIDKMYNDVTFSAPEIRNQKEIECGYFHFINHILSPSEQMINIWEQFLESRDDV